MIVKKNPRVDLKNRGKLHFFIGLTISLLLIIGAFEWRTYDRGSEVNIGEVHDNFEEILDVPVTEQPPPPPPKLVLPEVTEVADEVIIEEKIDITMDIEITEETEVEEVEPIKFEKPKEETADEIFLIVQEQPEFYGGIKEFYRYVSENIEYPSQAKRMNIEGRVFVEFVVNKDGSLTNFKIAKGIGGGCDEEAIRVLKESPKWKPGKQRGVPVRVRMIIPIHFRLMNNKR